MITLTNHPHKIELSLDKTVMPEAYWGDYRTATIYKNAITTVKLEINDAHVIVHFVNGGIEIISHNALNKTVHPEITDNIKLKDLIISYIDEFYTL